MAREKLYPDQLSEFLRYLADCEQTECERLPALSELSRHLGVSIATLREQLEVARSLGLVEVKPKTGIKRLPYTFKPAVTKSLAYAISVEPGCFQYYSDLRNHIEESYFFQSAALLTQEDHFNLKKLVASAFEKLDSHSPQMPHSEHRELHLSIYRRLGNPFVSGLLEAYWEMYESAGFDAFSDYSYIRQVWQYHEKLVEQICAGNYSSAFETLKEHMDLLAKRPKTVSRQKFE